jgi:ribosome recycling factor
MADQYLAQIKDRMTKAVDVTREDLATIRTGRATPVLVENIDIMAYGGSQRLKLREMATITSSDARTLVIVPYDPSVKDEIIKGIQEAKAGFTPVAGEGNDIRITIPALTEERRQEYIKLAHAKLEAGRIMVRQIRHDEMSKLKRAYEAKEITEDDRFRTEKQIQEITDEMVGEIDSMGQRKEEELMQI